MSWRPSKEHFKKQVSHPRGPLGEDGDVCGIQQHRRDLDETTPSECCSMGEDTEIAESNYEQFFFFGLQLILFMSSRQGEVA